MRHLLVFTARACRPVGTRIWRATGVDGKGGHTHYEQIYVSPLAPRSELYFRRFETLE